METKAELVSWINAIIKNRKLTKKNAEEIFGIAPPRVSELCLGGSSEFSVYRISRIIR